MIRCLLPGQGRGRCEGTNRRQPDEDIRELRQQTTERAALVSDRTRLKNRVHAVLHQRLIQSPYPDLFDRRGRAWPDQVDLDPAGRRAIDSHLRQLDLLDSEQDQLQRVLAAVAWRDPLEEASR